MKYLQYGILCSVIKVMMQTDAHWNKNCPIHNIKGKYCLTVYIQFFV